jgi:hypothetical protein
MVLHPDFPYSMKLTNKTCLGVTEETMLLFRLSHEKKNGKQGVKSLDYDHELGLINTP